MIHDRLKWPAAAIYYNPLAAATGSSLRRRLRGYLSAQTNARPLSWMVAALAAHSPNDIPVIEIDHPSKLNELDWKNIKTAVLLWPDATGIGWSRVESEVRRHCDTQADVWVLNGRRRVFSFAGPEARALRFRRMIESSMLLNFVGTALFFAVVTPLAAYDFLKQRS